MWDVKKLIMVMPPVLAGLLPRIPMAQREAMTEIRLRAGQPLAVTIGDRSAFLSQEGKEVPPELGFVISQELVQETLLSMCGYSLHGVEKTLEQGYFTALGGFRVGVCMHPYAARQGLALSLCIRLPREVPGAALGAYSVWQRSRGLIIAGPPASGKTTILRDLCRLISNGEAGAPCRTVLVDERNELSGWDGEKNAFQLGMCTDILSGLPKTEAVTRAIRTLSPQVVLCDEIAEPCEVETIRHAFFCGVRFVVTVHCGTRQEPFRNAILRQLMESGVFSHLYLLGLPAGNIKETVVTADEYYCKAVGDGTGFERLHSNGLHPGGQAEPTTPAGSSAGMLLGGLSAANGTDCAAACADSKGAGRAHSISKSSVCTGAGRSAGRGLWKDPVGSNAEAGAAGVIAKSHAATSGDAGAHPDGYRKTGAAGGIGGPAAGRKILGRAGEPAGGTFPETGGAGGTGIGGSAHLMEETAWKWILSSG